MCICPRGLQVNLWSGSRPACNFIGIFSKHFRNFSNLKETFLNNQAQKFLKEYITGGICYQRFWKWLFGRLFNLLFFLSNVLDFPLKNHFQRRPMRSPGFIFPKKKYRYQTILQLMYLFFLVQLITTEVLPIILLPPLIMSKKISSVSQMSFNICVIFSVGHKKCLPKPVISRY